jgi:hypothetical protein
MWWRMLVSKGAAIANRKRDILFIEKPIMSAGLSAFSLHFFWANV